IIPLFNMSDKMEKVNYINKNYPFEFVQVGANPFAKMNMYQFKEARILDYDQENAQHSNKLIVIQTENSQLKDDLLNEMKENNYEEKIAIDGYSIIQTKIEGYNAYLFLGDSNNSNRFTARIEY
ncbi:MAG: hypothetical protein ABI855_08620, partial [Bacteroidota bacterium]